MKAQITRKKINLPKFFFRELGHGGNQQLIAIFNLVKLKNSKDIFDSSKCKVTFGFKYICQQLPVVRYAKCDQNIPCSSRVMNIFTYW